MIRHAWSVLCAKSFIDRDTNNVSLDVLERVTVSLEAAGGDQVAEEQLVQPHVVPVTMELVSLWFSTQPGERKAGRARIELFSPQGNATGRIELPVEFSGHNLRTRARITGFGSEGPGTYLFHVSVDEGQDGAWQEVAVIPLDVAYKVGPGETRGE